MANKKKQSKIIKFFTNVVYGGWSAKQLETGIGGSEEKLIELARELAKRGHKVTIYMNGEHGTFDGVEYIDHREFNPLEPCDAFVSFKAAHILQNSINAGKILHFTTEIEAEWPKYILDSVDQVITISKYQNAKMRPKSYNF